MTCKLLAQSCSIYSPSYPAWKILAVILLITPPLLAQEQAENRFQRAAERHFERNDANKDGKLSREEFPEQRRRLFEQIDTDKDGFVTLEEDTFYRKSAPDRFLARNDANKDGKLSREEFPEQQRRRFERIDTDKDGFVTLEEDILFRDNQWRNAVRIPEGVTVHRDLIYGRVGERELPLDLYLPPDTSSPVPVVIWVHGGAWRGGGKGNGGRARNMTTRGFAVVAVEYRLSGEALFPAQIEDCKTAVRWVRANAKKYNLDPDRIGAWGSSAGGHLVALMGLTHGENVFETDDHSQYSSRVQVVCNWFGPTDFLRMNDFEGRIDHDAADSPESELIGGPIQENKEKVAAANPITYVSKNDPPMLILHGEKDRTVPYNQSELLYAAMQKAGLDVTLYKVVNAGHGFGNATQDNQASLFEMSAQFLEKHLKPQTDAASP